MGEFRIHHIRFFDYQPKTINCISFGKEINKIALSRSDASIEIWSVKNDWYQESIIPGGESRSVEALCWQEKRLFSTGLDGDVQEYDLSKLQTKTSASSNAGPLWCLTSDSAGKYLAAGAEEGCVVLFDTDYNSLQYYKSFDRQEGRILSLAWHPTEDVIVTGGIDNIRLWSVNSGHAVQRLTLGRTEKAKETIVWCVAFAKGMTIVSGDSRGKTTFWNGRQGTQIKSFQSHRADVLCLTVNESKESVFSSGVEPTVVQFDNIESHDQGSTRVWVRSAARCQHTHDVRGLAMANNSLVSGGVDTNIIINNVERKAGTKSRRKITSIPMHKRVHVARLKNLVLLQYTNYLELWKLGHTRSTSEKNGEILPLESKPVKLLQLKSKDEEHIVCSGLSTDGQWICYSDQAALRLYKVTLVDIDSLTPQIQLKSIKVKSVSPSHCITFSPDSVYLVSATNQSTIEVIALGSEPPAVSYTLSSMSDHPVHLLTINSDHKMAVADLGNNVALYDLKGQQKLCSLPKYNYLATALNFSADGSKVILAYSDQKVFEFSVEDEEYSEWCKQNSSLYPHKWLRRFSKISHISTSIDHPDKIFLADEQMICVLDQTKPFPSLDADLYNKATWSSDDKKGDTAFHICSRYKFMLHMELLEDNWMVIVEQTPMALLNSLPMTLQQKKFGT